MLHKIFIDGKYTIYTESVFMIDFQDGHVAPSHNHHEGTQEEYTKGYAVWQPHVVPHSYHCWGNNLPHINKALKNRKFIEGWEQIIAATQNINLIDISVILDFWERIYTKQKDLFCIQDNENPEIQLSVQDYQKLMKKNIPRNLLQLILSWIILKIRMIIMIRRKEMYQAYRSNFLILKGEFPYETY